MFVPHVAPQQPAGGVGLRSSFLSFVMLLPACASFMFFHAVKWLLHGLRRTRERKKESLEWRTVSELVHLPLALPYIMVTGPRWNPHALISRVGPFQAERSLRIRVETAHHSAQMWTLVISRTADFRVVVSMDSRNVARDKVWLEQALPAGRYFASIRYYESSPHPRLPDIEIDGVGLIPGRSISPSENDYLKGLRNKQGIFYTCLQYYILEMLRLQPYLPAALVRREYLPVGNPETLFYYGYLGQGQCVEVTSSRGLAHGHRLYLTTYNRSSFPVSWCEVRSLPYHTPPAEGSGSYLLRLHGMEAQQTPSGWPKDLEVHTRCSPEMPNVSSSSTTDRP